MLLRVSAETPSEAATASEAGILVLGVTGMMLVAGLTATAWPARRGIRIQPIEALQAEK